MHKFPAIKGNELKRFCEKLGFKTARQRGSHVRMRHDDGRVTTIPIHSTKDIPKGLLRKIIKEGIEMSIEDFLERYLDWTLLRANTRFAPTNAPFLKEKKI